MEWFFSTFQWFSSKDSLKIIEKVLQNYSSKKYTKHCINYERNFPNWHFHYTKMFPHGKFRQPEQQNTILPTMKVKSCLWAHIRAPELKSILIYHFRGAISRLIFTLTVIFHSFWNINITNYKKKRKTKDFSWFQRSPGLHAKFVIWVLTL